MEFLAILLLHFVTFAAAGGENPACSTLSPPHHFNPHNETLLNCYFPLSTPSETSSCQTEDIDTNKFPRCVAHSKCIKIPKFKYSETLCLCEQGYKMTSYFTCDKVKGEGESCQFWEIDVPDPVTPATDDCDGTLGLRCSDGVCQCRDSIVNGFCILGPGELCRLNQTGQNVTAQCSPNSKCAILAEDEPTFGMCTCDEGYTRGRGCQKLLEFGERCDDGSDGQRCNEDLGLVSRSGTCVCEYKHPDSASVCAIRINSKCSSEQTQASCPRNATCTNSICTCDQGFQADSDTTLCKLVKFRGEPCDDSYQSMSMCDSTSGLICRKRKCECERELSTDKKFCVVDTRDYCNLQTPKAQCTPNSVCARRKYGERSSPVGACKCNDGFAPSRVDGKCHKILSKGEKCEITRSYGEHFCNKELGLECERGFCICSNGETASGQCILKVGDQCNLGGQIHPSCPPNSKCQNSGGGNYCWCEKNFLASPDSSKCAPERDYMETCGDIEGVCLHNLPCRDGRCQCQTDKVFDPEQKECKSSSSCERDYECPSRASCVPIYEGSRSGKCECNEGYTKDSRSLCRSNYKTKCAKSADCFTSSSMNCVDGVCACAAPLNQIYQPKTKECVGLVGSPCGTENGKCVETAVCGKDRICRCPLGTTLLDNGKCTKFLNFGAKCVQGQSCNWVKGLACVNNFCACVDPNLIYLRDQEICVAKAWSRCEMKLEVGTCVEEKGGLFNSPTCDYYKVGCGGNTICKETERIGVFRCLA